MSKIELSNVATLTGINLNFQLIENELNNKVLYRNNPVGEPNNLILSDLDADNNNLYNINQLKISRLFINGVEVEPSDVAISNALKIVNNLSDLSNVNTAKTNLGLNNVDNTSDTNKPISTATSAALALKAPIASPAFTGTATFAIRPTFNTFVPWDNSNLPSPASTTATLAQFAGTTSAQLAGIITNETGSGNLVFNTSPAISSPAITGGTIDNTVIGGSTRAAGSFTTLSTNGLLSAGAGLTVTGSLVPSQTNGITGTTTNNNANAGSVGEYITNSATGVALTTGTSVSVTSISLTAGDWDVTGTVTFVPAGTTTSTQIISGISTTNNTLPATNTGGFNLLSTSIPAGAASSLSSPVVRISLASTTTVYLIGQCTFAVSTATANGFIRARRTR